MSELKPLVLLPLPKGHVLRKDVDWIADCPRLISVNASAGMIVDAQDAGYTTCEHWPEGVECPWVVRMNDERGGSEWPAACGVSTDTRKGPDEPGEGWRFLEPEERPIKGDQYWSVNIWEPSGNWIRNAAQAPEMKYRRRVERSMGPVERALTIENQTLKAQCERQAETIRELELPTADRKQSVRDNVHYVIDFNQPSQSELQAKIEALELQAVEYKVRCEQLQDRNTELRKQNERQITMVREEFARSSEQRSSVGELRWERRKPTEEEMWNCYYLTRSPVGLVVWTPGEKDESSECWTEVCILPDILPVFEPPKTVTERLWFVQGASQVWKETWREEGKEPKGFHQIHKTETTRERVVG